ncbi:MAG TPA: hypothetical protein VK603_18015 [Candidatus Saccharimonadales bacterium]|nr:hypothetical protein [Candidatus Saccharimonadales bacterium]
MSIDFPSALFDPIYLALGVQAIVTPGATSTPVEMLAMDQTAGIIVTEGKLGIQAIKPACSLRARELTANNLQPSDLKDGTITLWPDTADEQTWRIENYSIKPSPTGNLAGEVQLILIKVP